MAGWCASCEESYPSYNCGQRCPTCDDILSSPPSNSQSTQSQLPLNPLFAVNYSMEDGNDIASISTLAQRLSNDLLALLESAQSRSAPQREVTLSFLQTAGILEVDSRSVTLQNTTLSIGPLKMLCILASFSPFPTSNHETISIHAPIINGEPILGDKPLSSSASDAIVLLNRGGVSFADKAITAQNAGAVCLVVVQSEGMKWPFQMSDSQGIVNPNPPSLDSKDSSSTSNLPTIRIPVCMISLEDGEALRSYLSAVHSTHGDTLSDGKGTIRFEEPSTECVICADSFSCSHRIYKLPCRHTYHENCLKSWVEIKNTCPMCRRDLTASSAKGSTVTQSEPIDETERSSHFYA